MSLLSKLLGGKKPSLGDVIDLVQGKEKPRQGAAPTAYPVHFQAPAWREGPSGFSWGPNMPDEPNQFNYPGTYREYFENVFRTDFPAYRITRTENPRSTGLPCYTFYEGDRIALRVELLSQHSDAFQVRRDCARAGIPYLRFYYDHAGWWNTRAYVIQRVREALGA